jgi:hypothetical protein
LGRVALPHPSALGDSKPAKVRLNSYFPRTFGRYFPEFTSSSQRSRSSRAALTSFGSFFTFCGLARFDLSPFGALRAANFRPPAQIKDEEQTKDEL